MPRASSAFHTATSWQYWRCIRSLSDASRLLATIMLPMIAASAMTLRVRVGMLSYLFNQFRRVAQALGRGAGQTAGRKKPQLNVGRYRAAALLSDNPSGRHGAHSILASSSRHDCLKARASLIAWSRVIRSRLLSSVTALPRRVASQKGTKSPSTIRCIFLAPTLGASA